MAAITRGARHAVMNPMRFQYRTLTTLQNNPHIFVFPSTETPNRYILSLLPTDPPKPELSIGVTSTLPPTTDSFKENPAFLKTLHSVISEHAREDPDVVSQAQVMAFTTGANIGSGGAFSSPQRKHRQGHGAGSLGEGSKGGSDSTGRGGWIHISDTRNPPEFARIAWIGLPFPLKLQQHLQQLQPTPRTADYQPLTAEIILHRLPGQTALKEVRAISGEKEREV
ncbi:hypothetical protein ACJ72_05452 [Emergomyces africanus]|uniref:Uncharacterized protein n=1 Tax=Emergomyces africanus TaxID=1955775 RepID=A0A1B7NTW3_9EURO|nr:hypothetical protein ACJ72_05452 [Emergomyces africanus]